MLRSRIMNGAANAMSSVFGAPTTVYTMLPMPSAGQPESYRDRYERLRLFYKNTGLYEAVALALYEQDIWKEALKELRNPTHAAVEFYAATLWSGMMSNVFDMEFPERMRGTRSQPDAPTTASQAERLEAGIRRIWQWSNWEHNKQIVARGLPMLGDQYLKVATRSNGDGQVSRVFLQRIEPEHVHPSVEKDERGFITYIRVDVPQIRRDVAGKATQVWRTEVWDKASGRFRLWEHERGPDAEIDRLGAPIQTDVLENFGIDFIPFVHMMFRDTGEERGEALIDPCMTKIIEADRSATRLYQMLFRHNDATWVLEANMMDASGRPMPAPRINGDSDGTITLGENKFVRLPGMAKLSSLVPDINYEAALHILQDHMTHLRDVDLPELRYYAMAESQELSGIAIRYLMAPAIDRVLETRANAEAGLIQANQMALTIAAFHKLEGFTELGAFEDGDFEHSFAPRDVIPTSELEEQEISYRRSQAAVLKKQYGYSREQLWREDGLDEEQIAQMQRESEAEQATVADQVLDRFAAGEG